MSAQRGWSLIEMLVVMVIVGILAAIALASYRHYTLRTNRSQAQQLMLAIMDKQQQYALDAREFTSAIGSPGLNFGSSGWSCSATCTNDYYVVSVTADNAATPPAFIITANPIGTWQARDGTLTLDSTGMKQRGTDMGW